ncbi:hypothetical protein BDN72DRAFT_966009 [Pluteus cervinus]|uniref:Uncharacterized protein n=1 Tax=Pluteus cervinus TaxID=181527 RepID=A0ACD3A1J8_9AGAR|nr:hypothetical protein BDN72DRAFT_966009 [Pluteus cervinus]
MDIDTQYRDQVTPISVTDPRLPREIEYEIFFLAFYDSKPVKAKTSLFRIAKRVSEWLIPLFYNVVVIHRRMILSIIPPLTTLKKYGHHIRHLFVTLTGGTKPLPFSYSELLSSCPNVSNLALWYGTSPTIDIDTLDLPIQRIAITRFQLLREGSWSADSDQRFFGWCSRITHIALGGPESMTPSDREFLVQFPALRYLLVSELEDGIQDTLRCCPQLKVVIRLQGRLSHPGKTHVVQEDGNRTQDIRVVKIDGMFRADWYRGTMGLADMWQLAEKEVERRREATNA